MTIAHAATTTKPIAKSASDVIATLPITRLLAHGSATSLNGAAYGVQQHVVCERLGEEFDSAGLHRLHAHWHVAVAGDEDDWHVRPLDKPLLQFQPAEPRKRHVEHQAAGNRGAWAGLEF